MATYVLYGKSDSYFNMNRFENSIGNIGILRQHQIKNRKSLLLFDRLLVVIFVVLFISVILLFSKIIYEDIKVRNANREIAKLEETLSNVKSNGEKLIDVLQSDVKYDKLKTKAYLELNMITPTESHIIYFDKSDAKQGR